MPLTSEIQRAIQLHGAGRFDEAEQVYRAILAAQPDEPGTVNMLGMLLYQRGNPAAAEPLLVRSLQLGPGVPEFHSNFALFCRDNRRLDEALKHLKRAIELNPQFAVAYDNLGLVLESMNRPEEAIGAYSTALRISPDLVDAHVHLAWAYSQAGRLQEAVQHWQRALQIQPNRGDAHSGLCVGFAHLRQLDQAIAHGQAATQLDPQNPDTHMNLGGALALQGRNAESIASLTRAVQLQPTYVNALVNLAWQLARVGDFKQSVATCRRALEVDPNYVPALDRLSHSLHSIGDLDGAIEVAGKAIKIDPKYVAAWVNLASAQIDSGDYVNGTASFRHALEIVPQLHFAHSNLLLSLHYDPDLSREAMFEEHQKYQEIQVTQRGPIRMSHANDRNPDRALRIGYVSPDFRQHPVTSFFEPILKAFDRSAFTVSCYSDVRSEDLVTQRLRGYASAWHNIAGVSETDLAQKIYDNREDILIDLTGHAANSRLLAFSFRPAPVQMTYLGYLNTTGMDAIDYRITDAIADPPEKSEPFYTEKLLRLPCFFCYQPPDEAPEVGALPASNTSGITFGSLNHPAKFNNRVLELWAQILEMIPGSRLVLAINAPGGSERRFVDFFAQRGVQKDRVQLIPRRPYAEYFAIYNTIDIGLDPFPFSGHTTTCDALWMGVPVVTAPGESYASRTCTSVLTHLGLTQLIATDHEQYCRIAADLANDLPALADLRASLRQRMRDSIITNAASFTASLEQAYRQAWRTWCENPA